MAHLITLCALGGSGGGGRARGPFHPTSAIEPRGDLSHCLCDVASGDKFFFGSLLYFWDRGSFRSFSLAFRECREFYSISHCASGVSSINIHQPIHVHTAEHRAMYSLAARTERQYSLFSISLGVCQTLGVGGGGTRAGVVLHISSAVVNWPGLFDLFFGSHHRVSKQFCESAASAHAEGTCSAFLWLISGGVAQ